MPEKQIEAKAQELCMAKDKKFSSSAISASAVTRMPRWTAEDVETLKRMHGTASNSDIAQRLGRTTKSITSKANALGLYKTAEHLRQMGRDNVDWRYHRDKCEEEENDQSSDGGSSSSDGLSENSSDLSWIGFYELFFILILAFYYPKRGE